MVKKKKHGFLIFCLVLLFITIVFGVVFRIQIPDCGVSKLSNIKEVTKFLNGAREELRNQYLKKEIL